MGQDDAASPQQQCVAEDDLWINVDSILSARGEQLEADQILRLVQDQQQQVLLIIVQAREEASQHGQRVLRSRYSQQIRTPRGSEAA